jgi:hypothetical protein
MGRIYQDDNFCVSEVEGRPLVRLCTQVGPEHRDLGVVVFARLEDPPQWHRFFIDAGLAVWEHWPDAQVMDELADDDLRVDEHLAGALPTRVVRAFADLGADPTCNRITLELENGSTFRLETAEFDGSASISIVPRS